MKVVFSFCVYGSSMKYCEGLTQNLRLIQEHYPEYYTYIYYYHNVPTHFIETYSTFRNVELRKHNDTFHHPNMVDRFFVLEDDPSVDIMIVRDSDSRIHARDRFCIDHFIESTTYTSHTVRDHHLHHSPILGGLWGLKREAMNGMNMRSLYQEYKSTVQNHSPAHQYGHDMFFLRFCIYSLVAASMVVYTFASYHRISDLETLVLLPAEVPDGNFCGQVLDYDEDGHEVQQYTFPF